MDASQGLSFGHSEKRDGQQTTGQYNVLLPDGRKQVRTILCTFFHLIILYRLLVFDEVTGLPLIFIPMLIGF